MEVKLQKEALAKHTTALLVEEASDLTMGQSLTVMTPHQIQSVLETKNHQWMMGGWLIKYQAMLLDTPEIILKICQTLSPATLVPRPDHHIPTLEHDCSEIIDLVYSSRPDLKESLLKTRWQLVCWWRLFHGKGDKKCWVHYESV